ncbi:MAG TPA: hypothetical protein VJB87_02805, partial [Candidatus Nanoarchaeia archaeon]|nr:hypothetical protein [Candidatus Nanoarchaeia archaeon]
LPQQIATGEHTLTITAKDTYGNIGTTTGTYTVDAVPTTLHFLLQEGTFAPEKEITYEAKILDQGEDLYKEDISITITDAKGNKLHQDTITSGTQQSYTLPKQAPPGNWKILAKSSIDEQEQNFYVKEIKTLDYQLQGNSLTITNTGNVPYKEPLKVTLEGFDRPVNIVRNINLDVGESDTINLASGTPTGAYTVNVGEKTFNDVNIEGQEKKDYSWVYYVILGLFVFVLLFIIMTKKITPIMNTTRKSYHAHDDHDHNEFIDPLLQEQLQRDLTRNRYQPAPRRTRTEHYPTLQTEDLNRFHSHGETTIFRKRREEKKQAAETNTHNPPSNNTFGGMFD